jgi:hypothetical protein
MTYREKFMQSQLRKSLIVSLVALGAAVVGQGASANSDDVARWQSVSGIAQANNVVGSGTGAVTGGGVPWATLDGRANVNLNKGEVSFNVRGLVLAGGNAIGTPGTVLQVKGTLVCDTDGSASAGNSVLVDTPLVDLDEEGNARFSGRLGALPVVCVSEPDIAFLIRVGAGRWIANGSVLR